jgi:hypothetical protein
VCDGGNFKILGEVKEQTRLWIKQGGDTEEALPKRYCEILQKAKGPKLVYREAEARIQIALFAYGGQGAIVENAAPAGIRGTARSGACS